jgi:hypothetical protein
MSERNKSNPMTWEKPNFLINLQYLFRFVSVYLRVSV